MKKIKYFIFIFILLFGFTYSVNAEVTTYNRTDDNNYGVNKDIEINDYNLDDIIETPYVDADLGIYDFANLLDDLSRQSLQQQIKNYQETTKMDIVIYTYNKNVSYDYNDEMAKNFYDYNDFGIDIKNYSGIILYRNADSNRPFFGIFAVGDAQFYYDVNRINNILDSIEGSILNANYFTAFNDFVIDATSFYNMGKWNGANKYKIDKDGFLVKRFSPNISLIFVISSLVTLIVVFAYIKRNKMVAKALDARKYIDLENGNISLRESVLTSSNTSSYVVSSESKTTSGGRVAGGRRG